MPWLRPSCFPHGARSLPSVPVSGPPALPAPAGRTTSCELHPGTRGSGFEAARCHGPTTSRARLYPLAQHVTLGRQSMIAGLFLFGLVLRVSLESSVILAAALGSAESAARTPYHSALRCHAPRDFGGDGLRSASSFRSRGATAHDLFGGDAHIIEPRGIAADQG